MYGAISLHVRAFADDSVGQGGERFTVDLVGLTRRPP